MAQGWMTLDNEKPPLRVKKKEFQCIKCKGFGVYRVIELIVLGEGKKIYEDCPECNGSGKLADAVEIKFKAIGDKEKTGAV